MGKKMKLLPSLLKNTESAKSSSSWAWPSCHQPKTLSFRAANNNSNDIIFKTINSAYLDATMEILESSDSLFTVSPDSSTSLSTTTPSAAAHDDSSLQTVIRRLRSDRLFFDPDQTSSLLESKSAAAAEAEAATTTTSSLPLFKDSVAMSMESRDPYADFRKSMEEMVEAHGVKNWEGLEELLSWYLRVNGKSNHGYIVGAFVDLLVSLALSSSTTTETTTSTTSSSSFSPSSPLSFYSSSMSSSCSTRCVSCLEDDDDEVHTTTTTTTTTTTGTSSSSLLEQVKEEIKHQQDYEPSSS